MLYDGRVSSGQPNFSRGRKNEPGEKPEFSERKFDNCVDRLSANGMSSDAKNIT
jgi:hypothetical protein